MEMVPAHRLAIKCVGPIRGHGVGTRISTWARRLCGGSEIGTASFFGGGEVSNHDRYVDKGGYCEMS
jgi:hypothetical protein